MLHDAILPRVKRDHPEPPTDVQQPAASGSACESAPGSSFTAIRRAWNVRVAT